MNRKGIGNLKDRMPLHTHQIIDALSSTDELSEVETELNTTKSDVTTVTKSVEKIVEYTKNNLSIRYVDVDSIVPPGAELLLVNATDGAVTITLPPVIEAYENWSGRYLVIKKTDASVNAVTVDGNESETIEGSTTETLSSQYDCIKIVCDGNLWYKI